MKKEASGDYYVFREDGTIETRSEPFGKLRRVLDDGVKYWYTNGLQRVEYPDGRVAARGEDGEMRWEDGVLWATGYQSRSSEPARRQAWAKDMTCSF